MCLFFCQFMHMSELRTAPRDGFFRCNMKFSQSLSRRYKMKSLNWHVHSRGVTCNMCLSSFLSFVPLRLLTYEDDLPTCDVSFIRRNFQISCFPLFLHASDPSFSSITHRVHVFKQLNLRPSPLSAPAHRSPGLLLDPLCMSLCSSSI